VGKHSFLKLAQPFGLPCVFIVFTDILSTMPNET